MPTQVTDPAILAQLNGGSSGSQQVTDPAVLAQLDAQPSMMQTLAASPLGRFAHDAVLSIPAGLASVLAKIDPTGGAVQPAIDRSDASYQAALAANRNRPGYAQARQAADAQRAIGGGSGASDQVISTFAPTMAGIAGGVSGLFGGSQAAINASNAAADAQSASQGVFAAQRPIASTAAQVAGGFLAGPEGAAARLPAYAGDNALVTRAVNGPTMGPLTKNPNVGQAVPTIAGLKAQAKAAYDAIDNSGQIISAPSYDAMVAGLKTKLANEGIDATLHPNALAAFKRLDSATGQPITFKGIDTQRKIAGDAIGAAATNKADQRLGYVVQDHIDDFVNRLQPSDLVAGQGAADPAQTVAALNDARGLYSRASQAQTIQNNLNKAALKSKMYSQSGLENATRAQFRQLALNDKAMSRLSPAVQQAVKDVATGSPVSNLLRAIGKYAPHGPVATAAGMGMGALAGGMMGAAEGGLASAAIPIAGEIARMGATRLTSAAAQKALDIASLGKTRLPAILPVHPLALPSIPASGQFPVGLFGSGLIAQQQNQ